MNRNDQAYQDCVAVLKEELLPAMGCTEPIAIAYCAAIARRYLGELPDHVLVEASGNIIKNVKSVVVPNTGGLRGIPAATMAGVVAGDPDKQLQVISQVTEEQKNEIRRMLEQVKTEVRLADTNLVFDIIVTLRKGDSYAKTRIANYHTNVVTIEKNGEKLKDEPVEDESEKGLTDRSFLSVKTIYDFANSVEIDDVREMLDRRIQYNTAIAEEGLRGDYGANVGSILLHSGPDTVKNRAKAYAAAGSDARMNGCELPVVINAGSGNQGITVTMPLVVYAKELGASQEQLYRALTLANLIGIHQKTGIGRLSAFCGAISAGAAAGCGVAYLKGGDLKAISHTLVNALAVVSGVICDGAKASCAGKIAVGVDAGIMGYEMYCYNQQFRSGDGIVKKGVENTIANVGRLGREGMRETDQEILKIMIEDWTNP